jgi:hypothetical protein
MNFVNNVFFDKGYTKARTGMIMIRPVDIQAKTVIYRFYDSTKNQSPMDGANGVWWIEFEHFQHIKHFALRNGYSLSYAASLFAAILYEYGEVDAYVACSVQEPLKAWKGRGKQVEQGTKNPDPRDLPKLTPMQSVLEIYQLCVPGLGGSFSIAPRVLKIVKSELI